MRSQRDLSAVICDCGQAQPNIGLIGILYDCYSDPVSLALAYDLGAWVWTPQQRTAYANDESLVLVAVNGPANVLEYGRVLVPATRDLPQQD